MIIEGGFRGGKVTYVEIDGVVCSEEEDFNSAKPLSENIQKINDLADGGHFIVYWSSRGKKDGKNYLNMTMEQLDSWGCKYHKISVGIKPEYDLFISNRAKKIEEI